ncbi:MULTISPECIES: hypothetical protein [unclassified Geodermatophilus]
MATSVLDAPLPTRVPGHPARWPVTVLLLAAVSVLQALALLAAGLTGLDGLMTATPRPSGVLVAAVLGGLAGWIVLCAAGGLAVLDGSGRRLPAGVAGAELLLVAGLTVAAGTTSLDPPTTLPLPALALLALAVPVGKLLLVSAPTTVAWAAAAPPRGRPRPAPVAHPRLRLATAALVGVALGALALTTPVGGEPPAPAAVSGH